MKTLTEKQAYAAMFHFLEQYWERGKKNDEQIAILLSGMSLLQEGVTADPAYWHDWNDAVEYALNGGEAGYLKLGEPPQAPEPEQKAGIGFKVGDKADE